MSARIVVLAFLSLLAASFAAPAAGEGELVPLRPREGRIGGAIDLQSESTLRLQRNDASRLVGTGEDLSIVFEESAGAEIAVRLTPLDPDGSDLGVGRVILIGPNERRQFHLHEILQPWQLQGAELRIETLRGGGRVHVVASTSDGGHLTIAPEENDRVRRRPVSLKTTEGLIDDALAAGAINEETAIVYRVYSLFSDSRLPPQFRGVESEATDSLYMIDVLSRFDSLSQETQALLIPFFTPPAYAGSWDNPTSPTKTARATPPPCQIFADQWKFVDSPSRLARVWYRYPDDNLRASAIGSEVDTNIWTNFRDLLKRIPVTDQNESCNGGSPGLDIYLVDAIRVLGITTPALGQAHPYQGCGGNAPPVFLEVKRTAKNTTVAHEVFHAFQLAFPMRSCPGSSDYQWWLEGSATWAEDLIYRDAQDEHDQAPPFFYTPENPLDQEDSAFFCKRCYSTYLLPFFVHRKTNSADFVRAAWENCATNPALEAVDKALPGGFEEVWREFVLRNWNRESPTNDYQTWDKLFQGVRPIDGGPFPVSLSGQDFSFPIKLELPRLSATYKHFQFPDDKVRTVTFWNGATMKLGRPDEYQTEPLSQTQKKGAHIWALVRLRGKDWTVEDWTDRGMVTFCRDRLAERLAELVIIISNSEFDDRDRKLQAVGLSPLLWVSNMGCWQWTGFTTATLKGGDTLRDTTISIESTDVTFTSFGGAPPFIFYSVQGTLKVTLSGGCRNTNGTPITMPIDSSKAFMFTHNFTPPGGMKHRGYIVNSVDSRPISGYECRDSTGAWKPGSGALLPPWVFNDKIEPPLYEADANGFIDDTYVDPEGVAVYIWHFEPKREPDP